MTSKVPRALWKLTIDPRGKLDQNANAFEFCRQRGVVGVGWKYRTSPSDRTQIWSAFEATWPGARRPAALRILAERASVGDLFWVYGSSTYFVCRVDGEWEYRAGGEWDDHDIHNIRPATWRVVAQQLVPGLVRRKMTIYGAAQIITTDPNWCRYSQRVFDAPAGLLSELAAFSEDSLVTRLRGREPVDLFQVLDEDETEDLVGLYLQEQGWRMIKSSTYRNQRGVECLMRQDSRPGPQTCCYQVKSGNTSINPTDYAHLADLGIVYVFSTAQHPYGDRCDQVIALDQSELAAFLVEHIGLMEPATQLRLALWAEM